MKKILIFFRLRKYRHTLRHSFHLYQKKKKRLSEEKRLFIETTFRELQEAILGKNIPLAQEKALKVEKLTTELLFKTPFEKMRNFIISVAVALCLAVLIRQMWFEFYEIPTGSMRPTLKEKDRLVVSKSTFGINRPLSTDHFYFSPELVERNGIIVFTGENMDIRDVDTLYFYLFPGKKQYVKRLMAKPGDTIYFYGGLLYGIDKEGNDISPLLQLARLDHIEHVPILQQFEGKVSTPASPVNGIYSPVILRQMNEPVAKMTALGPHQAVGEMLLSKDHDIQDYADLWGIKNFGMARILTKQQALLLTHETIATLPVAPFYLEIQHHPSLHNLKIRKDPRGRLRPMLDLSSSLIPLEESYLKTLFENLYTVRFVVHNGTAHQYGVSSSSMQNPFAPKLPGVPDGTYEFYYGKAYKISFGGIATELKKDHPLYQFSPERVLLFYNLGMEFDTRFSPQAGWPLFPFRYVYFRNEALYTMGAPLFLPKDPVLQAFNEKERTKEMTSSPQLAYRAFKDDGAPLTKDGTLDKDFIKKFGLTIPEKMYLALGDNHAVSADSREFGFVPQENLKGAPDWIFWPPGARFGSPNQPPYPFMNFPRSIVWLLAAICIGGSIWIQRRRNKLPLL